MIRSRSYTKNSKVTWNPPTYCPNCRKEFDNKDVVYDDYSFTYGNSDTEMGKKYTIKCTGCGWKGTITDDRDDNKDYEY